MANQELNSDRSRYVVPILERALGMVEFLGGYPEGLSVTELSDLMEIPKNSAFRIAVTLEAKGYVERLEPSKRYRLTTKFMTCGVSAVSEHNLFEKSLDVMRGLRDETRETVLLGVLARSQGVVLDQVPGLHPFRFCVDPGIRFDLHTAAPGKAMLAYLPEAERCAMISHMGFKRYTPNTITGKVAFARHLDEVRERGYGFDLSEEIEGQYCIGAPIFDSRGYPVAAVWITAPSSRLPDAELDAVGRRVRSATDRISARLGYVPKEVTA